jgi:hypothetical protein
MIILGKYSFNDGKKVIEQNYSALLQEVYDTIVEVDSSECLTKKSKEKTMPGKILYNPRALNDWFKVYFARRGWTNKKVKCDYPTQYYVDGYKHEKSGGAYRDMDFVKDGMGVEVQFGKYAFMVYNVCAKMTIFNKMGFIKVGIEVVPIKEFADRMSTGVSYFEQFVWDLEQRGVSNIDIPVLILGVGAIPE